jgi:hypothetical protein
MYVGLKTFGSMNMQLCMGPLMYSNYRKSDIYNQSTYTDYALATM